MLAPAILRWKSTDILARLGLTLPYWWSGLDKLCHPTETMFEFQSTGLPASWWLYGALLVVQLGGSLFILVNRLAWFGAGMLAIFTAMATYVAHAFWKLEGAQRFAEMNSFLEHVALIAGFVFAAMYLSESSKSRIRP